tara:strand:- start:476 stop:2422 length:1947 start_codon:yes stop_codon:yes gene_type:complete
MTISLNTPRNTYTASAGQTDFTIGFEFFAVADVKAYKNGTLLTYNASPSTNSQYSLVGTASSSDDAYEFGGGGTLKLGGGGASANDIIVIIRDIAITRTSDFSSTGTLDVKSINTQLDQLTAIVGDLKGQTDRSVKLLDTDTAAATVTLPAKATRQDKIMGFDSNGNIETTVSSSGLATLSSIATDIQTVAGISSDVSTVSSNNANITTLAGLNSQITSLGAISSDITTLAGFNSSDISTVAADISKVVTAANDLNESTSEIEVVANAITNVDLVGGSIANVNAISPHIANINITAANISDVNNFASVYRISSSAPTTSLDIGDLYFDTTANELKVYKSSGWSAAGSTINGTSARFTFTVSSSTTTITGSDDSGSTLAYDAGFVDVYLNGVKMVNGSDVTVSSGNSIVFASAIGTSGTDTVDVVGFGTFNVAAIDAANISSGTLSSDRLPVVPISKGGTGLSSVSGNADKVLKVNPAGNAFILGQASSPEVYGFNMSYIASTINYTVSVQSVGGSNKYFIMGEQQPTLELYEGNTYVFTHPSGHPFRFSTDSGNTSAYTTGVTVNSSTQVTIVVPSGAPTLYYYCSSHAGMGGQANTPVPFNNNVQVTTTNQGADDIDAATYAAFDDVLFSASGFTFSLNNGDLIATI